MWEIYYNNGKLYKVVSSFQTAYDLLCSDPQLGWLKRREKKKDE
jgi:hypothetical protein